MLGSNNGRKVDVRIVCATNRNLTAQGDGARFRSDLYYRIEVGLIDLPPLRERRSDIPLLALYAIDNINTKPRNNISITQEAVRKLTKYNWPGNVRQLFNLLERSVTFCRKNVLDREDLSFSENASEGDFLASLPEPEEGFVLDEFLSDVKSHLIHRALESSDDNQSAAARKLGVTPQAVHNFLRREVRMGEKGSARRHLGNGC